MNTAPSVFVPVPPKGDGLSAPTLLSLLAHGIILGLLIYNYQADDLTPTGSLETTMVSPEQLAAIQGQVLANRAAAQAAASSQSDSATDSSAMTAPSDGSDNVNPSPQRQPIFTESNEPVYTSDNRPLLMSEEQQQQILEEMQQYERESEAWVREQESAANERLEDVNEQRRRDQEALQRRLDDYQARRATSGRVEQPEAPPRNNSNDSGSGNTGRVFDLSDGISTSTGSNSQATSPRTGNSNNAGGSSGASNSEIVSLIRSRFTPPPGAKGATSSTRLTITVDSGGNVTGVAASSNDAHAQAAVAAVRAVGRFPIDSDDPKYPTFTVTFRGSN
ncbi:energy transducer TonB [Psychrobacter aestuarii]|nr:energy transducer TonB [Psychrobacter aestuarii]